MRWALVAALAMVGCGSDGGPTPVLRVQLDVDETTCLDPPELITFPCQGRVGVWLVDDFDELRDEFCVGLPEGTPLPGLDNVLEANDVAFRDLELGDTVSLELAVFNNLEGSFCERPFGGPGVPEPPEPALDNIFLSGKSNLVTLEQTTEIVIPLSCGVVEEQCDPVFTAFANVLDLGTLFLQSGPEFVERIQFGFALDGNFVSLGDMAFDGDVYSANLAEPPPGEALCVGAVVSTPSLEHDILSCDGFAEGDFADIIAYTMDDSILGRFNDGITDPNSGDVLVGRVVDEMNEPVQGAIVSSERGALITYPDPEADGTTSLQSTGKDGYFMMSGPNSECCQELTVTTVNGDPGGRSEPTGTVAGMVAVTVISSVPGDTVDPVPEPPQPTSSENSRLQGSSD